MITIPLTPLALSSGNITEKIVANTIIDKNQHFSYVVNAKEKNNTTAREIAKIINDDAKLKIGIH